jgi:hypothetical protein
MGKTRYSLDRDYAKDARKDGIKLNCPICPKKAE